MEKIIAYSIGGLVGLILVSIGSLIVVKVTSLPIEETVIEVATSDYIWIANNRFHKDSLVNCSPILDDSMAQIGEYIRVSYEDIQIFIECLSNDNETWEQVRDNWIKQFKGDKEEGNG